VTRTGQPDSGYTLYTDPSKATYGPWDGSAGAASYIFDLPANIVDTSSFTPLSCDVDDAGQFKCFWSNSGSYGDWWFCRGYMTLVSPGLDPTNLPYCGRGEKLNDVAWISA